MQCTPAIGQLTCLTLSVPICTMSLFLIHVRLVMSLCQLAKIFLSKSHAKLFAKFLTYPLLNKQFILSMILRSTTPDVLRSRKNIDVVSGERSSVSLDIYVTGLQLITPSTSHIILGARRSLLMLALAL